MPTEERKHIEQIKLYGWNQQKYPDVFEKTN